MTISRRPKLLAQPGTKVQIDGQEYELRRIWGDAGGMVYEIACWSRGAWRKMFLRVKLPSDSTSQ
jgi:hypothetical protein